VLDHLVRPNSSGLLWLCYNLTWPYLSIPRKYIATALFLVASARLSIQHCYREANQVAHCLAREAFIIQDSCIWGDDPFQVGLAMLLIHVSR
jgi:hypothetical protein